MQKLRPAAPATTADAPPDLAAPATPESVRAYFAARDPSRPADYGVAEFGTPMVLPTWWPLIPVADFPTLAEVHRYMERTAPALAAMRASIKADWDSDPADQSSTLDFVYALCLEGRMAGDDDVIFLQPHWKRHLDAGRAVLGGGGG